MGVFKTPGKWVTGYSYCSAHTAGVFKTPLLQAAQPVLLVFLSNFIFPEAYCKSTKS